jgi:hypothetical protein
VTFFVMADPQIHLDKWGTAGTEETIGILNKLPGTESPLGGKVAEPKGFLVIRLQGSELQVAQHKSATWRETWKRTISLGS